MSSIVEFFGIASAVGITIVGIVGYLGRKIIESYLNKDISAFKAKLENQSNIQKLAYDKQLEEFRSSLEANAKLKQLELDKQAEDFKNNLELYFFRQSKLHDKRIQVLDSLYKKIVILNQRMLEMTALVKLIVEDSDKEEIKRINAVAEAGRDFIDYFHQNKIYFEPEICELLDELDKEFTSAYHEYTFRARFNLPPSEFSYKKLAEVSDTIRKRVPPILEKLENDFRRLIGVIDK